MEIRGLEVATPRGPARVEIDEAADPRLLFVLTHGAGGGVDSADLLAVRDAVRAIGGTVARVVQPFRVAGARAPGSAARQDEAWLTVVAALRDRYPELPLVQGGRSNGARVACRTARAAGAAGVVAPGHTDSTGSDAYNLQLSQRRAEAVASYLVSQGIKRERLITVGAGEAYPIASNDTEEGRAANRRVELTIVPVTKG